MNMHFYQKLILFWPIEAERSVCASLHEAFIGSDNGLLPIRRLTNI